MKLDITASGDLAAEPLIVVSSGEEAVDNETISRLKRIKYTPAKKSSTGEAIALEVTAIINWVPGGE